MDVVSLRERCEALAGAVTLSSPPTVAELYRRFMRHAEPYYGARIGSTEATNFRDALRYCVAFYADLLADDFGPKHVKAVRQALILHGLARTTINARVRRIRHVWRWGVSEGLVDTSTLQRLEAVAPLKRGRSDARETDKVKPVRWETVAKTLPHLKPHWRSMVLLQWHTGMRPGEVCAMRPCDITTGTGDPMSVVLDATQRSQPSRCSSVIGAIGVSAETASINTDALPWVYRPEWHKNSWRGQTREVYLGRAAVGIVGDAMNAGVSASGFQFTASGATRVCAQDAGRDIIGPALNKRLFPYRQSSYYNAVRRACRKAKVEHWAVGQLRHAFKQRVKKQLGTEAARVLMGHANVNTTELYGERDAEAAREAVLRLG